MTTIQSGVYSSKWFSLLLKSDGSVTVWGRYADSIPDYVTNTSNSHYKATERVFIVTANQDMTFLLHTDGSVTRIIGNMGSSTPTISKFDTTSNEVLAERYEPDDLATHGIKNIYVGIDEAVMHCKNGHFIIVQINTRRYYCVDVSADAFIPAPSGLDGYQALKKQADDTYKLVFSTPTLAANLAADTKGYGLSTEPLRRATNSTTVNVLSRAQAEGYKITCWGVCNQFVLIGTKENGILVWTNDPNSYATGSNVSTPITTLNASGKEIIKIAGGDKHAAILYKDGGVNKVITYAPATTTLKYNSTNDFSDMNGATDVAANYSIHVAVKTVDNLHTLWIWSTEAGGFHRTHMQGHDWDDTIDTNEAGVTVTGVTKFVMGQNSLAYIKDEQLGAFSIQQGTFPDMEVRSIIYDHSKTSNVYQSGTRVQDVHYAYGAGFFFVYANDNTVPYSNKLGFITGGRTSRMNDDNWNFNKTIISGDPSNTKVYPGYQNSFYTVGTVGSSTSHKLQLHLTVSGQSVPSDTYGGIVSAENFSYGTISQPVATNFSPLPQLGTYHFPNDTFGYFQVLQPFEGLALGKQQNIIATAAAPPNPIDDASTPEDAKTVVVGQNAGNSEWKARKADFKRMRQRADYTSATTFSGAQIFGLKADGSARAPSGKEALNYVLAVVKASTDASNANAATEAGRLAIRKAARAAKIAFADNVHAPLDLQGESVAFGTSGDEVIEFSVKVAAADTSGTTTYEWFVMETDAENAAVATDLDGVTPNSGTVDVVGEDTGSVQILIGSTRYKFLLGGVTTDGSETVASSSGDPFVRPMFS